MLDNKANKERKYKSRAGKAENMARFVECSKPIGELEYEGEVAGGKLFLAEDGELYCHILNGGQEIWMIGLDMV